MKSSTIALLALLVAMLTSCTQVRLPTSAPMITSFTASPAAISSGESSTLAWQVTGADEVVLQPFGDTVAAESNRAVSPTETTTYTLIARNDRGETSSQVTVSVRDDEDPPLIGTFFANPTSISEGESSVLTWQVAGADSITISPTVGSVSASGNRTVSPTATTTYTLTATNDHGTVTRTATVTVGPADTDAPTVVSFTATPPTIDDGDSSTLAWEVTGADTITIDGGIGTVAAEGNTTVSPSTTTTYTLTATNENGTVTATATVTVNADPAGEPVIASFTATPPSISDGDSSTLAWEVQNADTITIDGGIGTVAAEGNTTVSPSITTSYTLTATNENGSATATATVTVNPTDVGPLIIEFNAFAPTIDEGDSATIVWEVENADTVTIDQGIGTVAAEGSITVAPVVTTTYTLTATNDEATSTASVTVTVTPAEVFVATVATGSSTVELEPSDNALLEPFLGGLLGPTVDLSVLSNGSLAEANVNLLGFLELLAAKVGADGPEAVLAEDVQVTDVVDTLRDLTEGTEASGLLDELLAGLPTDLDGIQLGDVIDIGDEDFTILDRVDLRVLDVLVLTFELFNSENVFTTPTPISVGLTDASGLLDQLGLGDLVVGAIDPDARLDVYMQIVEPPVYTFARSDNLGGPEASFRSAGTRFALDFVGLDLAIATLVDDESGLLDDLIAQVELLEGVGGLAIDAELDLTLSDFTVYGEFGAFEGYVDAMDAEGDGSVSVVIQGGTGHLHLGNIDPSAFFARDRSEDVTAGPGTVGAIALDVTLLGGAGAFSTSGDVLASSNSQRTELEETRVTVEGPFPATVEIQGEVTLAQMITDLIANLEFDTNLTAEESSGLLTGLELEDISDELLALAEEVTGGILSGGDGLGAGLPLEELLGELLGTNVLDLMGTGVSEYRITIEDLSDL